MPLLLITFLIVSCDLMHDWLVFAVSEMTCTVSSGMLNPSIPYHTMACLCSAGPSSRMFALLLSYICGRVWSVRSCCSLILGPLDTGSFCCFIVFSLMCFYPPAQHGAKSRQYRRPGLHWLHLTRQTRDVWPN